MHLHAGRFKGRVLLGPPAGSSTRPITGLAKKSLFDTLADWMPEAVAVDLYCGTGSMGLEALSRGARRVAFGEMDRRVLERLRRNIDAIGRSRRKVDHQLLSEITALDAHSTSFPISA